MKAFVLDASIAVGWMLDRPVSARASRARKLIIAGAIAVVPALWRYEVANAAVVAERRNRVTSDQITTLADDFEELSEAVEVDGSPAAASVLIETARRTKLTVYDATYLEIALRRRLRLATLDEKLKEAARRAGVDSI